MAYLTNKRNQKPLSRNFMTYDISKLLIDYTIFKMLLPCREKKEHIQVYHAKIYLK